MSKHLISHKAVSQLEVTALFGASSRSIYVGTYLLRFEKLDVSINATFMSEQLPKVMPEFVARQFAELDMA